MYLGLTVNLDPLTQSGLSITAKVYSGGALVQTYALTEVATGSACYTYIGTVTGLATANYSVTVIRTDTGASVGSGTFFWSGTAEIVLGTSGLGIDLDPSTQSGLTLRALLYTSTGLAGTIALTESPAGSASYQPGTITGLAAGLYAVTVIRTDTGAQVGAGAFDWNGSSENLIDAAGLDTAAGVYADQSDVENVFGTTNVAVWSNLENTGTGSQVVANSTRIQLALNYADAQINGRFLGGPFLTPISGALASQLCRDWAAKIAGVWLYESRGQLDVLTTDAGGQRPYNKYAGLIKEVYAQMQRYKGGALSWDAPRRWPGPTAPVGY